MRFDGAARRVSHRSSASVVAQKRSNRGRDRIEVRRWDHDSGFSVPNRRSDAARVSGDRGNSRCSRLDEGNPESFGVYLAVDSRKPDVECRSGVRFRKLGLVEPAREDHAITNAELARELPEALLVVTVPYHYIPQVRE